MERNITLEAVRIPKILDVGKPAPIWIRHSDLIERMIKEFDMKPLEARFNPTMIRTTALSKMETEAPKYMLRDNPCGGLRHPHIHYGDDIYVMKPDQWRYFSERVTNEMAERIQNSVSIPFSQLMELDNAAAEIF